MNEDFKEEVCKHCHHKQPSCEENIEDCYNAEDLMLEQGKEKDMEVNKKWNKKQK